MEPNHRWFEHSAIWSQAPARRAPQSRRVLGFRCAQRMRSSAASAAAVVLQHRGRRGRGRRSRLLRPWLLPGRRSAPLASQCTLPRSHGRPMYPLCKSPTACRHQVEGFQPLQSIQPGQPVQHLPQAQPMQQLQPMQPPQSLPQVQQVQQVQQMVLSPSSPSPGQAKPSQVARQAGARPASDDVLVSFTCRFPGCGKVYCSSDGARKHARIHHRQWLTDVEKDTRGREIDTYCIRWERKRPPATNPVAEQSRMPPPFATMRMIDGAAPGMPVAASCGVPPARQWPAGSIARHTYVAHEPTAVAVAQPPHPTAQPPTATAATPSRRSRCTR